ncbi:MAG: hypothetical protein QME61_02215, partial [Patescibacteria group bacterium]|nr:hypothetical protein [Patescibacteria group bacterium]
KAEVEEITVNEKEIAEEIQNCLKEIQLIKIKNKLNSISQEIKKAEEGRDFKKVNDLTKDFNYWANKLTKF